MPNPFEQKIQPTSSAETGLRFDMSNRPRVERAYWKHLMGQLAPFGCDLNSAVAKAEELKFQNDQASLNGLFKVLKAINEYTKNRKVADEFAEEYNEIVEVEGKKMHRFEAETLRSIVEEINQMYAQQRGNDSKFKTKDVDMREIVDEIEVNERNEVSKANFKVMSLTEIPKAIGDLVNLQVLSFFHNQISEIKGLDTLVNLQRLELYNNQISEIKGLDKLVNLQELTLNNNQISEIKGLNALVNLHDLDLSANQISEINGLETLVNLRELGLNSNQIREINELDELVSLRQLWVSGNRIDIKANQPQIDALKARGVNVILL